MSYDRLPPGLKEETTFCLYKLEPGKDGKKKKVPFGRVERKRPQSGGEKTTMLIGYRLKDTITDFLGYGAECGK